MQYNFSTSKFAVHASDLLPLFINKDTQILKLLQYFNPALLEPYIRGLRGNYQKYLASYATHGDPNTSSNKKNQE